MDVAKNFAKVTVDPNGNYDDSSTSIDLITGDGAKLPSVPFNAVWWNATDFPDPSDDLGVEIVRVTAISTDTLTITRGQEGTDPQDHNLLGKTYKMIAGLTAKVINEDLLGDVFGSGSAILITPATPEITLRLDGSAKMIDLQSGYTEIQQTTVFMGDFEGQGNAGYTVLDDSNSKFTLNNLELGTTQAQSASVAVGTLAHKLPIYDGSGTLLGYIPIYSSIV